MLEKLKKYYTSSDQCQAIEWLCDPSSYPSLRVQDPWNTVFHLYIQPSFHPIMSWTLYRQPDSSFMVRRVRWDFIADH
ncbi:hypothetical protein [Prosthecobacter sp.]|uniref:hypothetical protein n=1 Tax=Prosthecobacter sp. TaxID=1965333 RepID=UPI0037838AAE